MQVLLPVLFKRLYVTIKVRAHVLSSDHAFTFSIICSWIVADVQIISQSADECIRAIISKSNLAKCLPTVSVQIEF